MAVEDRLERRVVTVLFADVVAFTTLSEQLDAEDVATVQRSYFASVREVIELYGGTLEKFIGDAVMAVFGAPRAHDDDAERAVRAAISLTHAVESLGGRLGLDEGGLKIRVGVNTGEVLHNRDATDTALVTGDTVNVAARLQAAAPPGGVLVGAATALAVVDAIDLAEADLVDLKGKAAPVQTRLAVAVRTERSREHAMGALRAPLVGRDDVLARLRSAVDAGGRLLVVAPPGSGKSRVVAELAAELQHAARAWVRPDALGPFEPVAQLALSVLGPVALDQAEAQLRDRLVAGELHPARADVVVGELTALLGSRPTTAGDRDAMFAAWLEGFDALSARKPDVWLVEDVHWAAHDLLAFLDVAARQDGRLVLATSRPSLLERERGWCEGAEILDLPPLATVSAAALVHELVGDALPTDLVDEVARVSDGNPLFIEELLRTWISVGVLTHENGTWRLTRDAAAVALPLNVQAIYTAQLDDLRTDARLVVRRASVAGRRFATAALDPLGVDAPDEGLSDLVRRALLRGPEPDRLFGDGYVFRHALLRDAGYASLARAERASLHMRLAAWLPEAAGERWPEIAEVTARHLAAALEHAPALAPDIEGRRREDVSLLAAEWFERAARVALGRAAHSSARALVRRSLELTPADAVRERAQRLELLGDATATSADLDEAGAAFEEAAELYQTARDDAGAARATVGHGLALCQQIQFEAAIALADRELARGKTSEYEQARLVLLRARGEIYMGRVEAATREALARLVSVAQGANDAELELEVVQLQAHLLSDEGVSQAHVWPELERLARRVGRWDVAVSAVRSQGAENDLVRPAEALAHYEQAEELARAHGLTEALAWTDYARAETLCASGDWDGAVAAGRRALEVAERYAYHRAAVRTWFVLVPIASARADDVLLDHARRWWAAHASGLPRSDYGLLMGTATALTLGVRQPAELRELMPAFDLDHGGTSWFAAVEVIIERLLAQGETERADEALRRMAASLARTGGDPLARAVHELATAHLALTRGDRDAAAACAQSALDELAPLDVPWWRAKAIRALAAVGAAPPERVSEAAALEARLGLAAPAG
jgi:class 3 adenylate cyclase/tetratricopeptide (TPR) repeat protein